MLLTRGASGLALGRPDRLRAGGLLGGLSALVVDCVGREPTHLLRRDGLIGFLLSGSRTRLEGGQTPARLFFLGLRDAALAFVLSPLMLSLLLSRFEHAPEEPGPVVVILVVVHDHARVVLIVLVLGHDLECLGIGIGIVLPAHDRGRGVHVVFVRGVLRVLGVGLLGLPLVPLLSGVVELLLGDGKARGFPHLHPIRVASRRVSDHSGSQTAGAGAGDADAHQSRLHLVLARALGLPGSAPDGVRPRGRQPGCFLEAAW